MKRALVAVVVGLLGLSGCKKDEAPAVEYFPIFFTGVAFPGYPSGQPDQAEQANFVKRLRTMLAGKSYEGIAGYNLFDLKNDQLSDAQCDRLQNSSTLTVSGRTYSAGFAWPVAVCVYGYFTMSSIEKAAWNAWNDGGTDGFPRSKRAIALIDRDVKLIKDFGLALDGGILEGGDIVHMSKPIFDVFGKLANASASDPDYKLSNTVNNTYAAMADAGWYPSRVALTVDLLDPIRSATAPTGSGGSLTPGQPFPSSAAGLSPTCYTDTATFATSCYRTYVKQQVREVAIAKNPEWLFIGASLERYAIANPQDFSNLASLYREIYVELKDAGVRRIGPAFAWDRLLAQAAAGGSAGDGGAASISIDTYWQTVVQPFLRQPVDGGYTGDVTADLIGVSAYLDSADFGGSASNVPLDYFSKLYEIAVKSQ